MTTIQIAAIAFACTAFASVAVQLGLGGIAEAIRQHTAAYRDRSRMIGDQFRVQLERENRAARSGASSPPVPNDSGIDPEAQRIINAVGRRTKGPGL